MIPKSNELRIEVTTRCNYNCIICPREKLTRKIETMNLDLFKFILDKILNETSQYNTLTFPGMGEPLLDESLDDKIRYAKSNGLLILILTNGSMLSVDRFKKLENIGVDSIRVSMYGNTPETYNAIHGINNPNAYIRVKDNLTKISKIKNSTELILTYNVVENINDAVLDSWIEYWNNKVDLVEVWRPHNWCDAKKYRKVQTEKLNTCGRPFNTPLQIQVDGTVNMCCFDFNGQLLLGDLKKKSLSEIFSDKMFSKILECHTTGKFEGCGLICEACDQRNANKSDVMIYNSKFKIEDRVTKVSTTYSDIINNSKS